MTKRKLAAVMSADAAGYSRLMEKDEASTLDTLKAHFQLMGSLVEKHRGRVVAIHGDSLLGEFGSVVDAVQSAVEIQKELKGRRRIPTSPGGEKIDWRGGDRTGMRDTAQEGNGGSETREEAEMERGRR